MTTHDEFEIEWLAYLNLWVIHVGQSIIDRNFG